MQVFIKFFLVVVLFSSCKQTQLFIVRHAEKGTAPTLQDPNLTDSGKQRALDLVSLLRHKNITVIYSTNFKRTLQTATPLSETIAVPITIYSTDTLGKFIKSVTPKMKKALIVSHSNKILPMLDSLHVPHTISAIADNDYDNLFILTVKRKHSKKIFSYSLKESIYGAMSPANADSNRVTVH